MLRRTKAAGFKDSRLWVHNIPRFFADCAWLVTVGGSARAARCGKAEAAIAVNRARIDRGPGLAFTRRDGFEDLQENVQQSVQRFVQHGPLLGLPC
jgi:hypothetical protein